MRQILLMCLVVLFSGCIVGVRGPAGGKTTVVKVPGQPAVVIRERPKFVRIERTGIVWCPHPRYDIYYVDGYYYLYEGGVWWRSRFYDRGWVRVTVLPAVFLKIPKTHPRYKVIVEMTPRRTSPPPRRQPHPKRVIR